MATPSPSPSPPPPLSPPPQYQPPTSSPTNKPSSTKRPQTLPWTHQETIHLIQAYQEKWYSVKRGQLKASQWEEVAVTVAAKCGRTDDDHHHHHRKAKTAIQCRHKMEKLRRRYREEKRRVSYGRACYWPYFDLMDSLEQGPMPISARPLRLVPRRANRVNEDMGADNDNDGSDDQEAQEEEDDDNEQSGYRSKSRSINYILRKPTVVNRFSGNDSGRLPEAANARKRSRERVVEVEMREGLELELAGEMRAFAERMVGMERKKMEMMKETERWRMEMENKKMEMILDSQRKIIDLIAAAFGSSEEIGMEEEF